MSQTISRRTFVATAALGTAAAALASSASGALQKTSAAWADEAPVTKRFTTTCHGCIQACPCDVYLEDDVVVKIEGNNYAPTSQGAMCLKGLNQMHLCYSPRRMLYPLKRTGARGAENAAWERIAWDDAVELATETMADTMEKYGTYSIFCGGGGGGAYTQQESRALPRTLGSPTVFEPGAAQCYLPRSATTNYVGLSSTQSIGDGSVLECFKGFTKYEQAKGIYPETKGIVAWGAQPAVSQTSQSGRGMADLKAMGVKTIVVDPNMSPDAVKADIWLRVRPGADSALLLSWYNYIFENELYNEEFTQYWTNLPFVINPDTLMPYFATDVWPDYEQNTPDNTPAYVCYDRMTESLQPLEFGAPEDMVSVIDPEIFWTGEIDGVACKTAGQIYKETAAPWTLEKAEEIAWVPAELNEAAIRMYTNADNEITPVEGGVPFGLSNGVACEQQINAGAVTIGCMGLDMIMGYIYKRGATLTANGTSRENLTRPTYSEGVTKTNNVGYVIGATQAENEARIEAVENKANLYALNQLVLDRLGTANHKGMNHWWHSHIPSVLEAIKTGLPYKPRLWYDVSGNKLAMLATAESWYNVFPEVDFVMAQHPMMTSFHMEACDLMFPAVEWLESSYAGKSQLNYNFYQFPIIHLGEGATNTVPPYRIVHGVSKKLNDRMDAGSEIFLGYIGSEVGGAPATPSNSSVTCEEYEPQTSINASYYHERDLEQLEGIRFPLCSLGGYGSEEECQQLLADNYSTYTGGQPGDMTFQELYDNFEEYRVKMEEGVASDTGWVTKPSEEYWVYDQHEWIADDGLPVGFSTESRKLEAWCTTLVKLGNNAFPFAYPRTQVACDPSIDERHLSYNPDYMFAGTYAPICTYTPQSETAHPDEPGYSEEYPLVITNGRVYYFHHSTARHAPFAREIYAAPDLRINPATAEKYGIEHGDWVKITSRRGSTHGRAYLHAGMHENVLWMERFYNPECYDSSQETVTGGWRECNVNVISKNTAPYDNAFGSYNARSYCVNVQKSERPSGVWVEPEEFQPFMPTTANGWSGWDSADNGIGCVKDMDPHSDWVVHTNELNTYEG